MKRSPGDSRRPQCAEGQAQGEGNRYPGRAAWRAPRSKRRRRRCGLRRRHPGILTRHVNVKNLFAMAFMGLPDSSPEPWIFVAATNSGDGTFAPGKVPAIGFKPAEMFDRRDGDPLIVPTPLPTNRNPITNFVLTPIGDRRGVATAALFDPNVKLNSTAQVNVTGDAILDSDGLTNSEIADLIANPERTHFFSNDCFSCHSESTRRSILKLPARANVRLSRPNGVSGVDPAVLPRRLSGTFATLAGSRTSSTTERSARR